MDQRGRDEWWAVPTLHTVGQHKHSVAGISPGTVRLIPAYNFRLQEKLKAEIAALRSQ
jgi:hypothetical protein